MPIPMMDKAFRVRAEIHETVLAMRENAAARESDTASLHGRLDALERRLEESFAALDVRSDTSKPARTASPVDAEALPVMFVAPGHFYSPIVDTAELATRKDRVFDRRRRPLGIDLCEETQLEWLARLAPHVARLPFADTPVEGLRYHYRNEFFTAGDGKVLAGMLMELRPDRVVEIGSGFSSCVMMDVCERFLENRTRITFVEPNPERLLSLIRPQDRDTYPIHAVPVQDCDTDVFDALQAGDILFIDSTHVVKTGSDVNYELFEILPRLKSGVFVHFHDVFYPFEYLESWALRENRSWNEIYALRAFLTDNPRWEIVFFNDFMHREHGPATFAALPGFADNPGGSLWLRKR